MPTDRKRSWHLSSQATTRANLIISPSPWIPYPSSHVLPRWISRKREEEEAEKQKQWFSRSSPSSTENAWNENQDCWGRDDDLESVHGNLQEIQTITVICMASHQEELIALVAQLCPALATPWTGLLCQWGFPGKNTGMGCWGCHSLLQGIFPTQGSNLHLLHYRRILYLWATREAQGLERTLKIN